MFYSETLLAKNGPLARVWLASNLERKLSKQNVLSEKLETKVQDIIGTGQAPISLRTSSQLLLGVVRIYSRKARYLLDDCSEALVKIKMAFRPGNVDLPSNQSHTAAREALILPDTIAELDLFAPLPDPEDLLREPAPAGAASRDPALLDFGPSQLLPDSQTPSRREEQQRRVWLDDDDDLGLDLGLEPGAAPAATPAAEDRSIEIGRRAHTPKADRPSLLMDDDLGLDLGLDVGDTTVGHDSTLRPASLGGDADDALPDIGADDDIPMGGVDAEIGKRNAAALARASAAVDERRQRDSISPLSSIRSGAERDLEQTFHLTEQQQQQDDEDGEDHTLVQAAHRAKRRKVLQSDEETELNQLQIRSQQNDRRGITKAPSFLPRDPLLLQLIEMQRRGEFVSNIMGEGRMQGWAPELRGILSLEIVRQAGAKKRKRDSGIADVDTDGEPSQTPRLEIPQDEDDEGFPAGAAGNFDADTMLRSDDAGPLLMSDGLQPTPRQEKRTPRPTTAADEDDEEGEEAYAGSPGAPFDTTEAPLLHPSQSGPVSLGTKNAVHLLREHFAPDHPTTAPEPPTPSKRVKAEALFTDLCPEERTTRQDATKMFFELLVLGTKDAIKVEQDSQELGLPIRVRGKRGLWGEWAEKGAGGEIASQQQPPATAAAGI